MRCRRDIPARECPCREGSSNLARVTMAAAVLAGERGKKDWRRRDANRVCGTAKRGRGMTDFVMRAAELLGAAIKEQTESIRAERDAACADRDKAVREAQALRERVQALELKLLEVRKIAFSVFAEEPF